MLIYVNFIQYEFELFIYYNTLFYVIKIPKIVKEVISEPQSYMECTFRW